MSWALDFTNHGDGTVEINVAVSDFNNDGIFDVLVGNPNVNFSAGAVALYSGKDSTQINNSTIWSYDGACSWYYCSYGSRSMTTSRLGTNVQFGDFNGDTWIDIIVSGYKNSSVLVFYNSKKHPYYKMDKASWSYVSSKEQCKFGGSLVVANINNDKYDDVIIGAPECNEVYVFYGSPTGLNENNIDSILPTVNDVILGLGDVNGDRYDDLLITDVAYHRIYVYYGSTLGFSSNNMWKYSNDDLNIDAYQFTASMIGDINGDNLNDFAVLSGTTGNDDECENIYIFLGHNGGINRKPDLILGTHIREDWGSDMYVVIPITYVGALGDINSDGYDDFIVVNEDEQHIYMGSHDVANVSKLANYTVVAAVAVENSLYWPKSKFYTNFRDLMPIRSIKTISNNESSWIVMDMCASNACKVVGITSHSCTQDNSSGIEPIKSCLNETVTDKSGGVSKLLLYIMISLIVIILIIAIMWKIFKHNKCEDKRKNILLGDVALDAVLPQNVLTNEEKEGHESCDCSVNCNSQKKLLECFRYHHLLKAMEIYNSNISDNVLDQINLSKIIDDFLHLLHVFDNNDTCFEEIANNLGQCDDKKCELLDRYYQNRNIYHHESKSCGFKFQMLDKIHCYYQHCYAFGNRLSIQNKINCKDMKKSSENDIPINYEILNMRQRLTTRVKLYENKYSKYNQLAETVQNKNTEGTYSFGVGFRYIEDESDEKHSEFIENKTADLIVKPYYSSFKEELTQNKIFAMSINQFDHENRKAHVYFKSQFCQQHYTGICKKQILALLIYCNYDALQNEFSKTYRDNIDDHEHFYYLGKFLKSSVHNFGGKIDENIILFHGINEILTFPQLIGQKANGVIIKSPLSTSSELSVALNFTSQNKGLILKFGYNSESQSLLHALEPAKYFSTAWLSDYSNEKEHLFIENDSPLNIKGILDPQW
eukprot:464946_1